MIDQVSRARRSVDVRLAVDRSNRSSLVRRRAGKVRRACPGRADSGSSRPADRLQATDPLPVSLRSPILGASKVGRSPPSLRSAIRSIDLLSLGTNGGSDPPHRSSLRCSRSFFLDRNPASRTRPIPGAGHVRSSISPPNEFSSFDVPRSSTIAGGSTEGSDSPHRSSLRYS